MKPIIKRQCVLHGPTGSCLWSCLPLWFGLGMDSPYQPQLTLNTTESSRRENSSSGPSARHWSASLTERLSRASSSTYTSSLQRVYPTWPCVTAASLLLRPSASWKICAGSSQHASIALLLPWQPGHIHFWNLTAPFRNWSSSTTRMAVQPWRSHWLRSRRIWKSTHPKLLL